MSMAMYEPYESESDTDESTAASSDTDSTDNEFDGTTRQQRVDQDGRLQAMDQWRREAHVWINGPGRQPVVEGPGRQETHLGLSNTAIEFAEHRPTHVIMVDSLDRDQRSYPLPTQFKLRLPRPYRNIVRIDIVQIKMMCGFYPFSAARGNTTLQIVEGATTFTVTIPDGAYTLNQLLTDLQTAVAAAALTAGAVGQYSVTYSPVTGRITISTTNSVTFSIAFQTQVPPEKQTAYSNWGLGWNLGFGGQPVNTPSAVSHTATALPRLVDDYIFLRMNETEHMNSVDHTDLEDNQVIQDSTGQVSHYFGKLLLNHFGCYAQTFIESPKEFQPVLGRLDRLSFEWVDRSGNVLVGPDAATCDWNMTLRITEVKERATDISSLVLGSNQ
jgi:hypothetical protein